ncbi:MAG: glycosyltransferase [Verrucomicrobiota bacterium]
MPRVLLASPLPPPEHGGIINWTRVVRKEVGNRTDLELLIVDTAKRYRPIAGWPLLSRLLYGSTQALRDAFRVYRRMKSDAPDLIHLNTSGSLSTPKDIIILFLARRLGIPSVVHYHMQRPPAEITHLRLYWKATRFAMSLANAVVVLDVRSERCVQAALPQQRITILPTMVEMDVIDRLTEEQAPPIQNESAPLKLMFVGFVIPNKGVSELVVAWLGQPDKNVRLEIVGKVVDPEFQRELERSAAKAGRSADLHFHGAVKEHDDVLRHLLGADVFVLASHGESAPAVVLEAMGCGCPVVSTFTGAIPEMLDIGGPEECGLCVPPKDVAALTDALGQLLADEERRRMLGQRGRTRAARLYSVPVGCNQLLALWQSVARENPPARLRPSPRIAE